MKEKKDEIWRHSTRANLLPCMQPTLVLSPALNMVSQALPGVITGSYLRYKTLSIAKHSLRTQSLQIKKDKNHIRC